MSGFTAGNGFYSILNGRHVIPFQSCESLADPSSPLGWKMGFAPSAEPPGCRAMYNGLGQDLVAEFTTLRGALEQPFRAVNAHFGFAVADPSISDADPEEGCRHFAEFRRVSLGDCTSMQTSGTLTCSARRAAAFAKGIPRRAQAPRRSQRGTGPGRLRALWGAQTPSVDIFALIR